MKKKSLDKAQRSAERQVKYRRNLKRKIKEIVEVNPVLTKKIKLKQRDEGGRPRLEEEQPELLKTISDIAIFGASVDDRRRTETLRSCLKLKDLHTELKNLGSNCSQTSAYYRLLPRNYTTIEGRRHINTVSVKLCRAQNDLHKEHPDKFFATSTIRGLETSASILGPEEVFFLSQDDKARVPIGITAANKQAPFLCMSNIVFDCQTIIL